MASIGLAFTILLSVLQFHFSNGQSLWPNATVPFSICDQFQGVQLRLVVDAMRMVEDVSCVRFVLVDDSDLAHVHIRFGKPGGGCWSSFTGFSGRRQTLTLEAEACLEKRIILHELGHVLGFLHEHNRPDRDEHVLIIWERVPPEKRYAFVKRDTSDGYIPDVLTPYDHRSIMHYSEYAFTFAVSTETDMLQPSMISKKGLRLGAAETFSRTDVYRLNRLYNCEEICDRYQ